MSVNAARRAADAAIEQMLDGWFAATPTNFFFPASTLYDYSAVAKLIVARRAGVGFGTINHVGGNETDGTYPIHAKDKERIALALLARLLRAPDGDWWGCMAGSSSDAIHHALWMARERYPDAIAYYSTAAHPSIAHALRRLRMNTIAIRADKYDEMDLADLAEQLGRHRGRPAVVIACAGTSHLEAVDDIRAIREVLRRAGVQRWWCHVDAAMSGIPLGYIAPDDRPGFDFADGADSVNISGAKWPGSPQPYGVLITRRHLIPEVPIAYYGVPMSAPSNSGSGPAALFFWYAMSVYGEQFAADVAESRRLASRVHSMFERGGVPAFHNPLGRTVVIPAPSAALIEQYRIPVFTVADGTHAASLIIMPGRRLADIERCVADIAADRARPQTPPLPHRDNDSSGATDPDGVEDRRPGRTPAQAVSATATATVPRPRAEPVEARVVTTPAATSPGRRTGGPGEDPTSAASGRAEVQC